MVRCTNATANCPGSCPHKQLHDKSDACGKNELCSRKNIVVNCEKPYRSKND